MKSLFVHNIDFTYHFSSLNMIILYPGPYKIRSTSLPGITQVSLIYSVEISLCSKYFLKTYDVRLAIKIL